MRPSVRIARSADEGQQSVSVTTASAASTDPIGKDTAVIYSTVECFLVAGASPTATVAAGTPIPANSPVLIVGIDPTDKIAAIAATGSGTLYIRPDA